MPQNEKKIIIDPDLEQTYLDGYYFQTYRCTNCGPPWHNTNNVDVMIPKGKPRPKKLKCPNCEVESLE